MKQQVLIELDLTDVDVAQRTVVADRIKDMGFSDCPTSVPPQNPDVLTRLNPISIEGILTFQRTGEVDIDVEEAANKFWHSVQSVLTDLGMDASVYVSIETMF